MYRSDIRLVLNEYSLPIIQEGHIMNYFHALVCLHFTQELNPVKFHKYLSKSLIMARGNTHDSRT